MRLERSTTNRVVGGVCGGIAEYLAVDPTLVRVTFVIVTIITAGLGILGYILLLVLMPLPGQPAPFVSSPSPGESALRPTSSQGENSLPSSEAHAADTERRRMAMDLHDQTLADLSRISRKVSSLRIFSSICPCAKPPTKRWKARTPFITWPRTWVGWVSSRITKPSVC